MKFEIIIERSIILIGAQVIRHRHIPQNRGGADNIVVEGGGKEDRFQRTARLAGAHRHVDLAVNLLIIEIDTPDKG